jgi:hypothetical protein
MRHRSTGASSPAQQRPAFIVDRRAAGVLAVLPQPVGRQQSRRWSCCLPRVPCAPDRANVPRRAPERNSVCPALSVAIGVVERHRLNPIGGGEHHAGRSPSAAGAPEAVSRGTRRRRPPGFAPQARWPQAGRAAPARSCGSAWPPHRAPVAFGGVQVAHHAGRRRQQHDAASAIAPSRRRFAMRKVSRWSTACWATTRRSWV